MELPNSLRQISPSRVSFIFKLERFIDTLKGNNCLQRHVVGASLDTDGSLLGGNKPPSPYTRALVTHLIALLSPTLKYMERKSYAINISLLSSMLNVVLEIPCIRIMGG
jgi:hypothetical protein